MTRVLFGVLLLAALSSVSFVSRAEGGPSSSNLVFEDFESLLTGRLEPASDYGALGLQRWKISPTNDREALRRIVLLEMDSWTAQRIRLLTPGSYALRMENTIALAL